MSFSEEVSTTGAIAQGGVASVFITFFHDALQIMIPYLIVVFFIVLMDCYYGIRASQLKGIEIRLPRAIRRTISKFFEYICWIIVATSLALAVKWQPLQYIVLAIPLGIEISSIVVNYLFTKGKKISGLNIIKIIGDKTGTDLNGVKIEDIDNKEKK